MPVPAERQDDIVELCRRAVDRLGRSMPGVRVSCHLRLGDVLRVVAWAGADRLIYELRRYEGGVDWRAVETGEAQLVEDVLRDPDYVASDERVRSEIAVPLPAGAPIVVLDAEFPERAFNGAEADAVLAAGAELGRELEAVAPARR